MLECSVSEFLPLLMKKLINAHCICMVLQKTPNDIPSIRFIMNYRFFLPHLVYLSLLLCWQTVLGETNAVFSIANAKTHLDETVYRLDADLNYQLSHEIKEALTNAVAITLVLRISVNQKRDYIWNKNVAKLEQRYTLHYHKLSQRYVLTYLNTQSHINFAKLETALRVLGELRDFPLLDASLIEDNEQYQVEMNTLLDIEALPAPLRPVAYFSEQWRLKSKTYRLELKQAD